jgi:integrase
MFADWDERSPRPKPPPTTAEVEDFLRGLGLSGRSRNNYRRAIASPVYFAEPRGYLPKGALAIESVAVAKEAQGEIEIFTPEELVRLLEAAEPALIPFLTVGAFADLGHAEMVRLDWSEVRWADGFIEVKASKATTANRRLVPIPQNLKAWLASHRQPRGQVCPYVNMTQRLAWLVEAVDAKWQKEAPPGRFAWKHNALRHSFISYRVAQVPDVAQVALEAGTSPQMIFSNYRELVRPADAAVWFSISPGARDKMLVLPGVGLGEQQAESNRQTSEVMEDASGGAS